MYGKIKSNQMYLAETQRNEGSQALPRTGEAGTCPWRPRAVCARGTGSGSTTQPTDVLVVGGKESLSAGGLTPPSLSQRAKI